MRACLFITEMIRRLDQQQDVVQRGWQCTESSSAERRRSLSRESKCTVRVAFMCGQKSPVTEWSTYTSVDIVWKSRAERFGSSLPNSVPLNFPAFFERFFPVSFLPKKNHDKRLRLLTRAPIRRQVEKS